MTDIQTLIMPIVVIAFGLFAGGMYVYRKMTAGESFSWAKFLPTMGIGALASVVLYLASGALPSIDAIFTQIGVMMPGGAPSLTVIIAALLAIYNQWSKGSTTITAVPSVTLAPAVTPAAATSTPAAQPAAAWSPGFTVTPCFQKGDSPLPITLQVQGGMDAAGKRSSLQIDWMDGTPAEDIALDATTGKAAVSHAYTYTQGGSKYTGHSFYPEFTLIGSDGSKKSFNVDGKCCEIEVQSIKTA